VMAWYEGTLDTIFFSDNPNQEIKNKICSVLAGYVWDMDNPFVKNHDTELTKLARLIDVERRIKETAANI
ncbi:MAG: pyridine nucleotide-disulfide oxidoreductase, partial [Sphingobacteriales bacterium]|nr:pyridine nucleotide-disulfide oxidoreductase [Sphingobacteriales bacterium]